MKKGYLQEMAVRCLLLLAGLCIAHLGVTVFIQANLGSDPFNVLVQGLFRSVPWPGWAGMTHGRVHLLTCLLILLVLLLAERSCIGIGTVLCMALGGPIIDMFTFLLAPFIHSGLPFYARLLLLAAGCVILAFGMTIVISSEAGTGPNDLVAVVLSEKLHKPFGAVRVLVDLGFTLIGFLLGGVVGIGTVICAFMVGPAAQIFLPINKKFCTYIVQKFGGPRVLSPKEQAAQTKK